MNGIVEVRAVAPLRRKRLPPPQRSPWNQSSEPKLFGTRAMSDEERKKAGNDAETDDSLPEGAPPSADEEEDAADGDAKEAAAPAPGKGKKKAPKAPKPAAPKPAPKRKAPKEEGVEKAEKAKKKKSPQTHPRTLDMVIEALEEMKDSQGSSVQAIKNWIIDNYKTVRADMIKLMLRKAFNQGLQDGVLARPKGQTEIQMLSGRYKLGQIGDHVLPAGSKSRPRIEKVEPKKKAGKGGKGGKRGKGKAKAKVPVAAVKVTLKAKPVVARKSTPAPVKEKSKGKRGRPKGAKKK